MVEAELAEDKIAYMAELAEAWLEEMVEVELGEE